MINWFKRRNIYEKRDLCKHLSITLKYFSHWATEYRRPYRANAEQIIIWAQEHTPHDVPKLEELIHGNDKKQPW